MQTQQKIYQLKKRKKKKRSFKKKKLLNNPPILLNSLIDLHPALGTTDLKNSSDLLGHRKNTI
jgi:hypothetical protein